MDPFLSFLEKSPTSFHAASVLVETLQKNGYTLLREEEAWELQKDKRYVLVRDGSLVVSFQMPKKPISSILLFASHLDSPALKLKPDPEEIDKDLHLLSTEIYGGPLYYSWLDRDLCIAGRVVGEKGTRLLHRKEDPCLIPSLAIHLQRQVNEKGLIVNAQEHLKAIYQGEGKKKTLLQTLEKEAKVGPLLSTDLFLVPLEAPRLLGKKKEWLASYRLDNLSSAYPMLLAALHAPKKEDALLLSLYWDHEEIGSQTKTGANSSFLTELLQRIFQFDFEALLRAKSRSLALSIDVAHLYHPGFKSFYDEPHAVHFGKGVVCKWNANQKYATSSLSAKHFLQVAKKEKIPIQHNAGKSDIPTGSTVGPYLAAHAGISTIDIGIGCFAMHSARETVAMQDVRHLENLLQAVQTAWPHG